MLVARLVCRLAVGFLHDGVLILLCRFATASLLDNDAVHCPDVNLHLLYLLPRTTTDRHLSGRINGCAADRDAGIDGGLLADRDAATRFQAVRNNSDTGFCVRRYFLGGS